LWSHERFNDCFMNDIAQRVNAISMEVHPPYGEPNVILKSINQHGFTYAMADENLQRVNVNDVIDIRISNAIVRVEKGEDRIAEYNPAKEAEKKPSSRSHLIIHPSARPECRDGRWLIV